MFEVDGGWVATCSDLTKRIQRCNGVRNENISEVEYCDGYFSEFYENMKLMGKSDLVKQAGKVATSEFRKSKQQPIDTTTGYAGNWETNWGMMELNQGGGGTYTHDKGKITGSVRGKVLTGTWSEAPSYSPPNDAGDVKFTLSADGNSFDGQWRYGSSGSWRSGWHGTRKKKK